MIAIIDYNAGNVRSLQFALERLGVNSVLTNDPLIIESSEKVIFPGQGAAKSAMQKLKLTGFRPTHTSIKATCFRYLSWHAITL